MLRVAFDQSYVLNLPEGHRFPMEKYDLLPRQLVHEGTLNKEQFFVPDELDPQLAAKVHSENYLSRLFSLALDRKEQRATGFPHTIELIEREKRIMEGTRSCAEHALECGAAMNIAGGTHHAFTNKGEGFCLMNDQAIAAKWLLESGQRERILILDLDVHQGNGTAEIFSSDERVFRFSLHGKNNYPLKKERSDLDVELEDGTSDQAYLYALEKNLDKVLSSYSPDFVFYQCGVDILDSDQLGRLSVSLEGCKRRDEFVFITIKSMNVPVVCSMGGGYSKDIRTIVEAHANTFRTIQHHLF